MFPPTDTHRVSLHNKSITKGCQIVQNKDLNDFESQRNVPQIDLRVSFCVSSFISINLKFVLEVCDCYAISFPLVWISIWDSSISYHWKQFRKHFKGCCFVNKTLMRVNKHFSVFPDHLRISLCTQQFGRDQASEKFIGTVQKPSCLHPQSDRFSFIFHKQINFASTTVD